MQTFAGVFFKVGASQCNGLGKRARAAARSVEKDRQCPADDHRQLILADLITLGQVRIEVVFAGKNRLRRNLCSDREAKADCAFDCGPVGYGQRARQGQIESAGLRVGLGTKPRRRAREHF